MWILAIASFEGFRRLCVVFGLARSSGIVDSLLTLLTISIAVLILREPLLPRQYAGLALLLGGLFLVK